MAWYEKIGSNPNRYRGGWRTPDDKKRYTNRKTHPHHPYARKSDALAAAKEAEVRAARGAAVDQGTLSARVTWADWWTTIKRTRLDSDGDRKERSIVEVYLMPKWGSLALNLHKRKMVQKWVRDELTPGRAPSTVHRIYAVYAWSMNKAVEEEMLDASPCTRISLPTIRKKALPYVGESHVEALTGQDERGRPHLREPAHLDMIRLGLETGMRPGELCGLHADQVDLNTGWLVVSNVFITGQRVIRPWPKDKDTREVPLTQAAAEILNRRLKDRDLRSGCGVEHTDGAQCRSELVFRNLRGMPVTPHALDQAMRKAAVRAGVKHVSPYGTRRGFATWTAEADLSPFAIADAMGHAHISQTAGYVQRTRTARDRLRAARGETAELRVIEGSGESTKQGGGDATMEGTG